MRQNGLFPNTLGREGTGPAPQHFYVLAETPCPYLPDRRERKLITELPHQGAGQLYSALSRAGFRRSHRFAYRPSCTGCLACVPIRVVVPEFKARRTLKRIWRVNRGLTATQRPALATEEHYGLFVRYIASRHGGGDMAAMVFEDYRGMVEDGPLDTRIIEFRDAEGTLVAACLADWLSDGPSAVYSFFDPALAARSLGSYMVLWLIENSRHNGLPHVYLGYWIAQSRKMAYKVRFRPVEGLGPDGWTRLPDPKDA